MDKADIQRVALFRFAEQGYHATTLRHLAQDLGVTPAAFYYHFKNKDELLTSLIEDILARDLAMLRKIRRENRTNPLDEVIYAHVYGMCQAREESLIVEREAKYLPKPFRKRVARTIHEYERIFADCIAEEYQLSAEELELVTRAVVGLGASVVQWFHKDGPLNAHDVAVAFTRYARGILDQAKQGRALGKASGRRAAQRLDKGTVSFEQTAARIDEGVAKRRQISVPA
jgi:AcrR family transcriptional regulator